MPVQVQSVTGLVSVFFSEHPVRYFEDAKDCDLDAYACWCRELLSAGCTRRRPSSRPGSRRWPTPRSSSNAPSRRRPPPSPPCPSGGGVTGLADGTPAPGGAVDGAPGSLQRLRALLEERGGLLAGMVSDRDAIAAEGAAETCPAAALAAGGPRVEGREEEYRLLLEAIYEGYLVHYGEPRVVRAPEADLGLLAGDQLYAIGLARLVAIGDTRAVSELADTITLSALAQAGGEVELAEAVWRAGGRAVGWGSSPPAPPRQGAGTHGVAGGTRGNAHKCGGCDGGELGSPRYCLRRCPTDAQDRNRSTRSRGASRGPSKARPSAAAGSWWWAPTRPARSRRCRSPSRPWGWRSDRSSKANPRAGKRSGPWISSTSSTTSRSC